MLTGLAGTQESRLPSVTVSDCWSTNQLVVVHVQARGGGGSYGAPTPRLHAGLLGVHIQPPLCIVTHGCC